MCGLPEASHSIKARNTRLNASGKDYDAMSFQVSAAALRIRYEEVAPGS